MADAATLRLRRCRRRHRNRRRGTRLLRPSVTTTALSYNARPWLHDRVIILSVHFGTKTELSGTAGSRRHSRDYWSWNYLHYPTCTRNRKRVGTCARTKLLGTVVLSSRGAGGKGGSYVLTYEGGYDGPKAVSEFSFFCFRDFFFFPWWGAEGSSEMYFFTFNQTTPLFGTENKIVLSMNNSLYLLKYNVRLVYYYLVDDWWRRHD